MFRYLILALVCLILIGHVQGQADAEMTLDTSATDTSFEAKTEVYDTPEGPHETIETMDDQSSTTPFTPPPNKTTSSATIEHTIANSASSTSSSSTTTTPATYTDISFTGSSPTRTTTTTTPATNSDISFTGSSPTRTTTTTTPATNSDISFTGSSPTTTTTTTTTTTPTLQLLLSCNFTGDCFGGAINATDGTRFNTNDTITPPLGPTSDASSANSMTIDNKTCQFPYQPSIGSTPANWSVSFCYNGQCKTNETESSYSQCQSGTYGLLTLDESQNNRTISQKIPMTSRFRSGTKKGRLLYYYFFTVYENSDWGQTMSISVQTDGSSTSETSIDKVTVANVNENKWYLRTVSFDLPTTDFTILIKFAVANRTSNDSIYFALDDFKLYEESQIDPTPQDSSEKNLGLILGLSLGLGIPALAAVAAGTGYYLKNKSKKPDRYYPNEYEMNEDRKNPKQSGYSYVTSSF